MKQKLVAFPYIILSFSSSNITSIKKKNRDMASGIKDPFQLTWLLDVYVWFNPGQQNTGISGVYNFQKESLKCKHNALLLSSAGYIPDIVSPSQASAWPTILDQVTGTMCQIRAEQRRKRI